MPNSIPLPGLDVGANAINSAAASNWASATWQRVDQGAAAAAQAASSAQAAANAASSAASSGASNADGIAEIDTNIKYLADPSLIQACADQTINEYLTNFASEINEGNRGILAFTAQRASLALDQAQNANSTAGQILIGLIGMVESLGAYTFDGPGLAAFEADKTAGYILGEGPVVCYEQPGNLSQVRLNPRYFVYLGPDQTTYINLFDVLRALTGDTHYHPSF